MEDPAKMELRHWANFDQNYLKDFFRDQSTAKLTQVTLERDAARAQRDKVLADTKNACTERDTALLQREMAYEDRNAAWVERDKAITALTVICSHRKDPDSTKLMQVVNFVANRPHMGSSLLSLPASVQEVDNEKSLLKHVKPPGKMAINKRKDSGGMGTSEDNKGTPKSVKKNKQQDRHGKANQENPCRSLAVFVPEYDLSSTPVPVCSCTGTNRQCYRWGLGGWQSSCCTNFLSVYPLPMSQTRRNSRVAGRKMSAGAFRKLLERVAGTGVDISQPVDLKHHWAKHGTNKYVIVK